MSKDNNLVECVKQGDEFVPIKAMYESFSGWYWFITEIDKEDPNYAFGYVVGFESEWGDIDLAELNSLEGKVWKVPKKNWPYNSHVHLVDKSEIFA